jgi:beta-galactosidase
MNLKVVFYRFLLTLPFSLCLIGCHSDFSLMESRTTQRDFNFNDDWKFYRCDDKTIDSLIFNDTDYNDLNWEKVSIPHTPALEPLVVNNQWQGICWYRKNFNLDPSFNGKKIFLEFEGAMQIADVWINGVYKVTHYGGYLPFTIDLTDQVFFDRENIIAIRLDNRDNAEVPPGKALKTLDFCLYGGLYRNVNLHVTDRLHITDPVYAGKEAGGGIFARTLECSGELARIEVQIQVINEFPQEQTFTVLTQLFDDKNDLVAENQSEFFSLQSMQEKHITKTLDVPRPRLWHPNSPNLYRLNSKIQQADRIVDEIKTKIGLRKISFTAADGFIINGRKLYIRGTNRHQEYPYIGYALPDNANRRDALEIKKAGFNFVRLSHYPQSPSFLNACDELGILVMDAIPGWQFFGDKKFQDRSYQDCKDMIRRDRNHPSVIAWEVSLNESAMNNEFMANCQAIAHQEYPGDQCYTAGWIDFAYDIFIPARQHAQPPAYWDNYNRSKPFFIAEYGDWEYYAQNAGLCQPEYLNLSPEARTSRQLRSAGEKRLLQQALNYQESFNDNLGSPACGCANWLIFDYNRGYADDIESSGVMDIFRLPKFSYYFFKSQSEPDSFNSQCISAAPFVFIANYYTKDSDLKVKLFSNCQRITLKINGKEIGTQAADHDVYSTNLKYPPFTFKLEKYEEGTLTAIGYINDKPVAEYQLRTPQELQKINLSDNCREIKPATGTTDVFFIHAAVVDQNGTLIPGAEIPVTFDLEGPGKLIGPNPVISTAGISSTLVQSTGEKGIIRVTARSLDFKPVTHEISIK